MRQIASWLPRSPTSRGTVQEATRPRAVTAGRSDGHSPPPPGGVPAGPRARHGAAAVVERTGRAVSTGARTAGGRADAALRRREAGRRAGEASAGDRTAAVTNAVRHGLPEQRRAVPHRAGDGLSRAGTPAPPRSR
ncbi:hypothetical protein NGM37_61250 [Streptomyces sp. TRM76130]|nr:hypothetical protein [Streptomyces sp. TRM76130]